MFLLWESVHPSTQDDCASVGRQPMPEPCLAAANAELGNIEGAHRVHGWPVPLRVVNTTSAFPMAALSDIGEPPYVFDAVSTQLHDVGTWEIRSPEDLAAAAGVALPSPRSRGVFLDVGAQLGYFSLMFASHGFRVRA